MNRYKFTDASIKKAIKYINGAKTGPTWAKKFKDDLSVKSGKVFYKEMQVVPKERVEDILRKEIYKPNGDVPSGRDAAFHICKQRYIGISRRALMEFIRAQKPLGQVKAALPAAKRSAGERLKNYTFETDLVFLKKNDLEQANKKFIRDDIPTLTYFLTTIEKVTGLCRLDYVLTKEPEIVTPLVIKQCQEMAKLLKTTLKKCSIRSDRGGEFNIAQLKTHFKEAKNVSTGPAVENRNAAFQKCFFQILRQHKSTNIKDAMKQSEKLLNNTYNRIHKKTSNELVERADEKEDIKEYNAERKEYIAGDKRKPFEVNQHVRLLVKEKKAGIDYKRYKNKTYSEAVYVIQKVTKKAVPRKYYVNKRWYLQNDLLKARPHDKKSLELVAERDKAAKEKRETARLEHEAKRLKEIEEEHKAQEPEKKGPRRSRRRGAMEAKLKMVKSMAAMHEIDEMLDEEEDKQERAKNKKMQSKLSGVHKGMIRYLKKHKLPTGGSEDVLKRRIAAYKKKLAGGH